MNYSHNLALFIVGSLFHCFVVSYIITAYNKRRYLQSVFNALYYEGGNHKREYIPVRHRCQFSWFCDGKKDTIPKYDNDAWERAKLVAGYILFQGEYRGITEGATHYHATYVSPKWAPELDLVGRIGTHIFYSNVALSLDQMTREQMSQH